MFNAETFVVALVGLVFLAGFLAPLWMNRNELPPGENQNKCVKHKTDPVNDPRLIPRPNDSIKIIRLTNSGEFVDRCELTNALYELNWSRPRPANSFGATANANTQILPKLTILYIHGWKHDAHPDDTDLKSFSQLIQVLRDEHRGRKHVVGIYLGWNASAGLPGILENISFWVKKKNADRIAQSGVVTKIVSSIGSITRRSFEHTDQFIAVGHSFGARILYSATAQSLIYQTELAHPGYPGGKYRPVDGSADTTILLNPAFEASRYTAIDDITRRDESFGTSQKPLLITISTDNDWATKLAFPLGQWLGLSRSTRELATLGNHTPYITHTLRPTTSGNVAGCGESYITERFVAGGLCLNRIGRGEGRNVVQPHNPFLVASTAKDVIDGHNGIWAPSFRVWLGELIVALERQTEQKQRS